MFDIETFVISPFHVTVSFYTTWKHQKNSYFLIFFGGIERASGMKLIKWEMIEMNQSLKSKLVVIYELFFGDLTNVFKSYIAPKNPS